MKFGDEHIRKEDMELVDIVIPGEKRSVIDIDSEIGHNKRVRSVVLSEGVEKISMNAFLKQELTEVTFPSSIKYIGCDSYKKHYIYKKVVI